MKKSIVVFLLICQIVLGTFITANAEVEFEYCRIAKKRLSEGFSTVMRLETVDESGMTETFDCTGRIRINGSSYKVDHAYDAIPEGALVKMAIEDDSIMVINFGTESRRYENVQYDKKRQGFDVLDAKQNRLPMYYQFNNSYAAPYLDENHYYDIEVHQYGINITDMRAKDHDETIKLLDVSNMVRGDFSQSIDVYCESTLDGSITLKGELYDKRGKLIAENEGWYMNGEGELTFRGLANQNEKYTVKCWMADRGGKALSPVYTTEYKVPKAEIKGVMISKKALDMQLLSEVARFKATDVSGTIQTYDCARRVYVNGSLCKNAENAYNNILENSYSRIALVDGIVVAMECATDTTEYANVEYNKSNNVFVTENEEIEAQQVYYNYDGYASPAYLDENHYYDIEVNKSGICITDMRAKGYDETIKLLEVSNMVRGDFSQSIDVYCETTFDGTGALKGELYDKKGNLVAESEGWCQGEGELSFRGLANQNEKYTVKCWIIDRYGNALSPVYTKEYNFSAAEIKGVMLSRKGIKSQYISDVLEIRVANINGEMQTLECADIIYINGTRYKNAVDAHDAVVEDCFAKIAIDNGVVTVIECGSGVQNYTNAEYDMVTNAFVANDETLNDLPVYYKYRDDFAPVYLDGNHYYDIEVSRGGICITDMVSKDYAETIKLIEVSNGVADDFSKCIEVYCETTTSNRVILKGELCDAKGRRLSTVSRPCSDYGDLQFDNVRNMAEDYQIKLWLEENGERITSVYTLNVETKKDNVKYGNVHITYDVDSEEQSGKLLNVRDIDGKDRTFICDENTRMVGGISMFALSRAALDIPEDSFVKMVVEDDVVKVIQVGLDTLEISSAELRYEDDVLNGTVYVLNNTEDIQNLRCFVAIYDSTDAMKIVESAEVIIQSEDIAYINPEFEGYVHESGDYVKIFAWDKDGNIKPLIDYSMDEILF